MSTSRFSCWWTVCMSKTGNRSTQDSLAKNSCIMRKKHYYSPGKSEYWDSKRNKGIRIKKTIWNSQGSLRSVFFDFSQYTIYVSPGGTDMRKGADSLARSVYGNLQLDAHCWSVFLFCSRNRKTQAVIVWDNGFWLMKKRIYSGTFAWPKDWEQAMTLNVEDVKRLVLWEDVFRRILLLPNGVKM